MDMALARSARCGKARGRRAGLQDRHAAANGRYYRRPNCGDENGGGAALKEPVIAAFGTKSNLVSQARLVAQPVTHLMAKLGRPVQQLGTGRRPLESGRGRLGRGAVRSEER